MGADALLWHDLPFIFCFKECVHAPASSDDCFDIEDNMYSNMIMAMESDGTANVCRNPTVFDGVALLFLPSFLGIGWLAYLGWILGIPGALVLILGMVIMPIILGWKLRYRSIDRWDLRWIAAPLVTAWMFLTLGWFNHTLAWADAVMHLFQAANHLGISDFIPPTNLAYRSPVVPGLLGYELMLGRDDGRIIFIPFLLMTAAAWQIQSLGERVGTVPFAVIAAISFLLLPTTRYWGQMAMTDVASAGLWVLLLHSTLHSDDDNSNQSITRMTGLLAGLLMLTKYTYVYALGLAGWFLVYDRSMRRPFAFLQGWLLIMTPWLIHQMLTEGHPFYPILGQMQFTVESTVGVVGEYTPTSFMDDFLENLPGWFYIISILGLGGAWRSNPTFVRVVAVLAVPLIILNGLILDWGEPRYNLPLYALAPLALGPLSTIGNDLSHLHERTRTWMPSMVAVLIILIASSGNLLSLEDERQEAEVRIDNYQSWNDFENRVLEGHDDVDLLLAGRFHTISWMADVDAIRFNNRFMGLPESRTGDYLTDCILSTGATHLLTTNVAPYIDGERLFDHALGHPMIELQDVEVEGWWSAALWRVDTVANLPINGTVATHNGTIHGDLLILREGESMTVGPQDVMVRWFEITTLRPDQQAMRVLTGQDSLILSGDVDPVPISGNTTMSAHHDRVRYIWLTEEVVA